MTSTIKEHLIAAPEATWRVREVRKFHADDEHTTLEALEIWSEDDLICEDVDTEDHACLISAAPDLLEALKDVIDTAMGAGAPRDAWDKAHAAIAKAEGRQP